MNLLVEKLGVGDDWFSEDRDNTVYKQIDQIWKHLNPNPDKGLRFARQIEEYCRSKVPEGVRIKLDLGPEQQDDQD